MMLDPVRGNGRELSGGKGSSSTVPCTAARSYAPSGLVASGFTSTCKSELLRDDVQDASAPCCDVSRCLGVDFAPVRSAHLVERRQPAVEVPPVDAHMTIGILQAGSVARHGSSEWSLGYDSMPRLRDLSSGCRFLGVSRDRGILRGLMRNRFDHLAKEIGEEALTPSGTTVANDEINPETQYADLRHEPDPARQAERERLGLLGRLAAFACLIEVYSQAPNAEELREEGRRRLIDRRRDRRPEVSRRS
jgi:hypothetical protein